MTTRGTDRREAFAALLALAVAGVLARVLALGDRIAHWGEARLGYDVLRYAATGVFEYRPVTHGPLLYHVDRFLFETVGASDFAARFPVAVVGGLLPLAAWLYRDHLRDLEVVALGALLATNPVLVYYSRFARNDVLVAAFAFNALGLLARTRATGSPRYLYAASGFGALAFASKANALLYALAWVAAGLVVLDQRASLAAVLGRPVFDREQGALWFGRVRARVTPEMAFVAAFNPLLLAELGPFSSLVTAVVLGVVAFLAGVALDDADRIADRNAVWALGGVLAVAVAAASLLGDSLAPGSRLLAFAIVWFVAVAAVVGVLSERTPTGARIRHWRAPVTIATVCFLLVTLVMFAPRDPEGLGLWSTLGDPTALPALLEAGLVDPLGEYGRVWLGGQHNDFLTYARTLLRTLGLGAVTVVVAGVLGFVSNRYGDRDELVEFCLVWAGLSVFGYPIAAVVDAPWHAAHVVVALAVPAAVAIAAVVRRVPRAGRDRNVAVAGVAVLVLCVAFGAALATAAGTAYLDPQAPDNPFVQYGQSDDDFRDTIDGATAAIEANENGTDVVYYGAYFHVDNASTTDRLPVGDLYTERDGEYVLVGENEQWYNRLPLAWYFETADATVDSAERRPGLQTLLESEPPVVVTRAQHAETVGAALSADYRRATFNLTQRNVSTVVFVNESASDAIAHAQIDVPARNQYDAATGGFADAVPWIALAPLLALGVALPGRTGKR